MIYKKIQMLESAIVALKDEYMTETLDNIIDFDFIKPRQLSLNVVASYGNGMDAILVKWCAPDIFSGGTIIIPPRNYEEVRGEIVRAEALAIHYLLSKKKVFGEISKRDVINASCVAPLLSIKDNSLKSVGIDSPRDEKFFGFMSVKYNSILKLIERSDFSDFHSIKVMHEDILSDEQVNSLFYADLISTNAGQVFVSKRAFENFAARDVSEGTLDLYFSLQKQIQNKKFRMEPTAHQGNSDKSSRQVWSTQGSRTHFRLDSSQDENGNKIKVLVSVYEGMAV